MAKRQSIALVIVGAGSVLCVLLWLLLPPLFQCYAYRKFISQPSYLASLSIRPNRIELPHHRDMPTLSFGYAQFAIDPELIKAIRCYGILVVLDCNKYQIVFDTPFSNTYDQFKKECIESAVRNPPIGQFRKDAEEQETRKWQATEANPISGRLTRQMIEDPYTWKVKVANTLPKTYSEVFHMEPEEFQEYVYLAFAKLMNCWYRTGIGIFEAEYVNGVVYFTDPNQSGTVYVEVHSKDANIRQSITLKPSATEEANEVLFSLLASYKFIIPSVPDANALHKLTVTQLENYSKFQTTE